MRFLPLLALSVLSLAAAEEEPKWYPLFNGKDLSGWTPKIAKHPLGENYANTFQVEDGMIKVSYDGYPKFDQKFGHLFTNLAYSRYVLRMEYRFAGKMMADAEMPEMGEGEMAEGEGESKLTPELLEMLLAKLGK